MPPIMGAAAFLMAEFLELPYTEIVVAATLPALLYYFAIFIQVDLIADRDGISVVRERLPRIAVALMQGWHFIVLFAILIYALFELNMRPEKAAIYSTAAILATGMVKEYGGARIRFSDLYAILAETGRVVIDLLMIVSGAGIVIGILNLTGLSFALTLFLADLAGGNMWRVLLISAAICTLLGMGMPTFVTYILLAVLVVPAIIEAGIAPLPAHLFILYFGMMSMITPPIALAAFAAATLTKASPMATGFVAMCMGWVAYVMPFMFVVSPSLLLSRPPALILSTVAASAIGVYIVSVGVVGYFRRRIDWVSRAAQEQFFVRAEGAR